MPKPPTRQLFAEELEPRVLLSAAPVDSPVPTEAAPEAAPAQERPADSPATKPDELPDHSDSEILVSFLPTETFSTLDEYIATQAYSMRSYIDFGESHELYSNETETVWEVALIDGIDPLATASEMEGLDSVGWADLNYYFEFNYIPDDTQYSGQYHHGSGPGGMNNEAAWDIEGGNHNIIVAVTDTGVDIDHVDLIDNIWINPGEIAGNGIDDDANGFIDDINGWDTADEDNDPNESGGTNHGTHVAGIIGASTNNGTGVAGTAGGNDVDQGVTIMPVRIGGSTASIIDIAEGFVYAVDNGADIINLSFSFGGAGSVPSVVSALNHVYDNDVLLFLAQGNSSAEDVYGDGHGEILFVASTDSSG
ncbi:MAG: S8 family serine peptidase, partial [Verrucomicrobiota bacterium]